jgi:LysR family cyn operon transcriptional activator
MKLAQLRTFVAIADNAGFARAADRLHLTQSAASRQIALLEQEFGLLLFDRDSRNVKLTPAGEDLLRRSRQLIADAESLGERVRALRGGEVGVLRVSATPQVIERILAPFLIKFMRSHPGVEVRLFESGSARYGQLERGEIDLAIMPSAEAQHFERRLLYPIYVLAVVARTHRFGRRVALDLAELDREPLLLLKHGFGARAWFDAACEAAEIRPRILLESGAPATLVAVAEVGQGIAIIPSNVNIARKAIRAVRLVHRTLPIGRWSSIVWNQHRYLPKYAIDFVENLANELRRAYPGREFTKQAPQLPRPSD